MSMYTLEVRLSKAMDLPASDFGFLGMGGKSDPYVTLKAGRNAQQKSSVINNNLNPVWTPAEVFLFQIDKPKEHILMINVFDHDRLKSDDLLASRNIALAPFMEHQGHSEIVCYDLELAPEFARRKLSPTLYLEIKLTSNEHIDRVLELWENQRYHVVKKWVNDAIFESDRKRWSSVDDSKITSDAFEDAAPKVPNNMTAEGWTLDVSVGDSNGWLYAPSFSGPWQKDPFTLALVRRRKWINRCVANNKPNNQLS